MSYIIRERLEETTDRSTGKIQLIANIVADDAASLPANTSDLEFILGSEALCVDSGLKYRIDSNGNWIQQPGSAWTDVYSKSEVDALLAALPILSRGDLYRGYQITANTDIDTLTDYGTYYCDSGTTAATLSNCPITGSGFIMIIYSNGNRVRLFIAVSANYPRMLIQARTGGTWRTVREFAMLDQIPASTQKNLADYSLTVGSFNDSTGQPTSSNTRLRTDDYIDISGYSYVSNEAQINDVWLQTYYYFYAADNTYIGHGTFWRDRGLCEPVPTGATKCRVIMRYGSNPINVSDLIYATFNVV